MNLTLCVVQKIFEIAYTYYYYQPWQCKMQQLSCQRIRLTSKHQRWKHQQTTTTQIIWNIWSLSVLTMRKWTSYLVKNRLTSKHQRRRKHQQPFLDSSAQTNSPYKPHKFCPRTGLLILPPTIPPGQFYNLTVRN